MDGCTGKLLVNLLIMAVAMGMLAAPVYAESPDEADLSIAAIVDAKQEVYAGLPAGRTVVVDGQIVYVPTRTDILASELAYAQLFGHFTGFPRTPDAPKVSGVINYPISTQETANFCGPAVAQQVIRRWTGITYSQDILAASIGASPDGPSLAGDAPGAGSVEKAIEAYANVKYEQVWSPSEQQVMDSAYYSVFISGLPACINLAASPGTGFAYGSSGHILSTSGYDDTGGIVGVRVADPHNNYTSHRWHTAAQISDAINAAAENVLIY